MKEYIGTCVENPFSSIGELCDIVENGTEISKRSFLRNCIVASELRKDFNNYPSDYQFYKSQAPFTRTVIYYYDWSAIEHFYAQ